MRIAFDQQAFCRRPYTGISRYITRLAEELSSFADLQVRIFAQPHVNALLAPLPQTLVSGFYLKRHPRPARPLIRQLSRHMSAKAIRHWKPDIVHETYYSRWGIPGSNCPVLITVHDMIHELFPEHFHRFDRITMQKRAAVQRADHIISVSDSTRKDLIRLLGVPAERITVVHLGVDLPNIDAWRQAEPNLGFDLPTRPFLLYVGERSGYKNFSLLLQAYCESLTINTDFDLVAFGGGAPSSVEIDWIHALGFSNRIHFRSGDDRRLAFVYSTANLLVYPSKYEGFGLPPVEAMSLGCPVICSNRGSLPEVVGDAAQQFDPDSLDDLTNAITRVALDSEVRANLIERGRRRAAQFSWQRCAKNTAKVYEQLCR